MVLKRDNGSNLNQHAVDALLARYLVIPLNSPPHYPPYNGGIESAMREMKAPLHEKILASGPIPESQAQSWAEMLASELNHNPAAVSRGISHAGSFRIRNRSGKRIISTSERKSLIGSTI